MNSAPWNYLLGSQYPIVVPRSLLIHFEIYAKIISVGIPGIVRVRSEFILELFVWYLPVMVFPSEWNSLFIMHSDG
jgi:hypothetical protein